MKTNIGTPPIYGQHPRGPQSTVVTATRAAGRRLTILAGLGILFFTGLAKAGTLMVVNNADSGAGSLRAAIAAAASGDTINVDMTTVVSPITLSSGPLLIDKSLTITGPGADQLTISGHHASRVFTIDDGTAALVSVQISGLTIADGNAGDLDGGGIYSSEDLSLNACVISFNSTVQADGGGIANNFGTLNVINCTVSGNSAGFGGGVFNRSGTLNVINCTVSGNSAFGGGGVSNIDGTVTVVNSTISGNLASIGGGGVYNPSTTLTIVNSTVTANSAGTVGGGIYNFSGTLMLKNSILAGNTAASLGPDSYSTVAITSNGANFIGTVSDIAGGVQPTDKTTATSGAILLGPLANNGGPTLTHALLPGSPAIDAGNNADSPGATDQRGYLRMINGTVDIGAFEFGSTLPSVDTSTTIAAATGQYSDTVTLQATVSPDTAPGSVQFSVNGSAVGSPVAVSGGAATLDYTIDLAAGSYEIKAVFTSSDADFIDSEGTSTLTVSQEDAAVAPDVNNPSAVKVNVAGGTAGPITLQATITEWQNGPNHIAGTSDELGNICLAAPVSITLTPVGPGTVFSVPVAAVLSCDGTTLEVQGTFNTVPVNVYEVSFSIGGDYYTGSGTSVLAVYDPSLGFVTGGGKIPRPDGWAEFGGNAKYLKNGQVQGSVLYIEHRSTGDVVVKSNSMQALSIVGNTGIILTKATVADVGNYSVQAVLVDNGEPGVGADQFGLQVWAPNGTVMSDLTFGPETLVGGNIQVPHRH